MVSQEQRQTWNRAPSAAGALPKPAATAPSLSPRNTPLLTHSLIPDPAAGVPHSSDPHPMPTAWVNI